MTNLQQATARAIVNVFETGRVRGDYGAIAVLKGDSGHLSYGRSQTTLGSGGLFKLINQYCQEPNAQFSTQLTPFLPRLQQKDVSLDNDATLRGILKQAGDDRVMQNTQDQFFSANFFAPALRDAEAIGVTTPLGQTVVYDSHIQGGWGILQPRIGAVNARGEQQWIQDYVKLRRDWLLRLNPPLPTTVYRMDSFSTLIAQNGWTLPLPLTVHGVSITEAILQGDDMPPNGAKRLLTLQSPFLRGKDVVALQAKLAANGLAITADGVYGPFTDTLVKQWQTSHQIIGENGAGPKTLASLGL
jgi:chitosanase